MAKSEAQTRSELIDIQLRAAGWDIKNHTQVIQEFDILTVNPLELAEPRWPNVGEKLLAKDRRIYVSTYPTMLNIIRDESQAISPHFFDIIVVDESHRSIYNTYGEVLDYFKTITLGLTATPTDIIDHNCHLPPQQWREIHARQARQVDNARGHGACHGRNRCPYGD